MYFLTEAKRKKVLFIFARGKFVSIVPLTQFKYIAKYDSKQSVFLFMTSLDIWLRDDQLFMQSFYFFNFFTKPSLNLQDPFKAI